MVFEYLAILIFILLALEVLLFFLVKIVRKNFQWLITKNIDDKVIFDQNLLKKFKKHSFHKKLGWEPKVSLNDGLDRTIEVWKNKLK